MEENAPEEVSAPKRKRGRPPKKIADPAGARALGACDEQLGRALNMLPPENHLGERWCWSCCQFKALAPVPHASTCLECDDLQEPYLIPAEARVEVDGEQLAEFRRRRGWSQQQVGDLWNVTRATVSNFERNGFLPLAWQLRSLCRVTEVSLEDLLWQLGATRFRRGSHLIQPFEGIWADDYEDDPGA